MARWLNSIGVSAAVLKYRLGPKYRHPAPLHDAQRAIRYVRSHAAEWKIAPNRIGVMGFSAGGHLASTASTHFDDGSPDAADPIERESCRPDFSVLCYPVISFTAPFAHRGSVRNLLGENPDPQLLHALSNETKVNARTKTRTFLFHTAEDTGVSAQNSLAYYQALLEHKIPAELHVYQNGPHGVGLAAETRCFRHGRAGCRLAQTRWFPGGVAAGGGYGHDQRRWSAIGIGAIVFVRNTIAPVDVFPRIRWAIHVARGGRSDRRKAACPDLQSGRRGTGPDDRRRRPGVNGGSGLQYPKRRKLL